MSRTWPEISPSPWCSPYSKEVSNSSCIPRQMPSSGFPAAACRRTARSIPVLRSFSTASPKAPTPGRRM